MSFKILGTGSYAPEHVVTNDDLSAFVDTNDEWITQRIGVRSRHISETETNVDMAVKAAERALENAGISADELDLIIATTITGDTLSPGTGCMVQNRIGAHCPAFDLAAACSGFLFALETAAGFLSRGRICIHLSSSGYWSKGTDICRSSRFFVAPGFSALPRTAEGDMPCRLMIITWVRVLYFAGWTLSAGAQPFSRPFGCGPSFRNGPISEKLFYLCQIFCGG